MKFLLFCLSLLFFNTVLGQEKIQKPVISKKTSMVVNNNPYLLYIVKTGDTYSSIAKDNNLTIKKLYGLNAINKNNALLIGTSLFIRDITSKRKRTNNKTNGYHIVVNEDTLFSIAKKYNTSVDQLLLLNNLNSNTIFVNQRLRIQ